MDTAVALARDKRQPDGTWLPENRAGPFAVRTATAGPVAGTASERCARCACTSAPLSRIRRGCHIRFAVGVFMSTPVDDPGGDMASRTRVPATEITGILGNLLKVMSRKMLGQVPEGAGVMWHYPAVLKDMMGFGRKVDSWNRLDRNLASFATMAAAAAIGCSFCLDFHYFMTHNRGLDETKAREVPRWRESTVFTPLERKVMEYAEAMSQTPLAVTDAMSAALLEDLGAPALLELAARIGAMNLTARSNVARGIRSQEFSASWGLPPLAAPSANGLPSV
jgi:AhpD family alkylhydroperoxidase